MTERDPRSRFEDEGIPDLQDGTPEQQWAEDPQEMALPGERPVGVEQYGTTADEQTSGESLDHKLDRERPDEGVERPDTSRTAGRIVEEDEGARPDREKDNVADDVGPDSGGFTVEEDAMRIEEQ
ncbi:DUF5709 domain-containing protein [Thermomonospora umbrina]|uniref:DUF5709 domain-containing protein n=1 Tax=Thermomonospora umbrina TaxID=111806 RepID=A0A3D9SZW0_9ACTN|nr:DUF5709 domain-containing protein [Thermomonospora umbrina]REF00091.1 hypothetical protein DFJ69_5617 [Thermomonospora umbrina]